MGICMGICIMCADGALNLVHISPEDEMGLSIGGTFLFMAGAFFGLGAVVMLTKDPDENKVQNNYSGQSKGPVA